MKQKFTTKWKSSKQPRKQRKFIANAPLHIKRKSFSANLSKELRKKHEKRNIPIRKGDKVKVMRGTFKKKEGKVNKIMINQGKVYVDGIQTKKMDGSNALVPLKASNLQIIELDTTDKKRVADSDKTQEKKKKPKKEENESKTTKKTKSNKK